MSANRRGVRDASTLPRTEPVAPGVYAYIQPDGSWWVNNAGFVVGASTVLAIDSASTQRRAEAYRDAIGQISPHPVSTLVNTHHHGDHTNGNSVLAAATIVAHRLCRDEILAIGLPAESLTTIWEVPDWGSLQLAPPTVTYDVGVDVWVDGLRCEVRYIGTPAHTNNDSFVWIPEHRVLFTGDLVMNDCTPYVLGGSLRGSILAIETLKELSPTTVIPGHGEICGPEIFDTVLDYLHFVEGYAQEAHRAGLAPLDAARQCDLGSFAGMLDSERIAANLHRAYSELNGEPRGAPIDRRHAMLDMVAYHGGRLPSHA